MSKPESSRRSPRAVACRSLAALALITLSAPALPEHAGRQEIRFSEYGIFGHDGRVGSSEVTEFRRADGSRSYLVREHQTFFGPILDRFMLVTLDSQGRFDSGHWVATSEFSHDFAYRFAFDGKAIRGEWTDTNRGHGWADVPAVPGAAVVGFWGFPESLVLSGFEAGGADRQTFEAVNIEDNLHRQVSVAVQRLGRSAIEVPAGKFDATQYRVHRYGDTHQWLDEKGTLLRWATEGDEYRWDLERYPSRERPRLAAKTVAKGTYEVSARNGAKLGTVEWSLEKKNDGALVVIAAERLSNRTAEFRGSLNADLTWQGSSETVDWTVGEGGGPPVLQHFETFFHRKKFYLLRFQDRAYPYLQSRPITGTTPFHLVNYPISATFWLARVQRDSQERSIGELAMFENNYWGPGVEVQNGRAAYVGKLDVDTPRGRVAGHAFKLRYPGGWHPAEITYWTDEHLVPVRVQLGAGKGYQHYRLVSYSVLDAASLPSVD